MVRMPPAELEGVDLWIRGRPQPKPSRPEAIRRLVELGLKAKGKSKSAPPLKFRPWTAEDDARLKSLIEASVSIDLIAVEMKRTTKGVKSRARVLGMPTKRVWVGLKAKR